MANSWQEKQNRVGTEKRITTMQELYNEMIESMRQEVVSLKNKVIEDFIKAEMGLEVLLDLTEISKRGHVACAEDTSEVFHWDGKPRIYFAPIDMQNVNGTMRPVLKFQRIPLVEEATEEPAPDSPETAADKDC